MSVHNLHEIIHHSHKMKLHDELIDFGKTVNLKESTQQHCNISNIIYSNNILCYAAISLTINNSTFDCF